MPRRFAWAAALFLGLSFLLVGQPVNALITAEMPLSNILATSQHVFLAKVQKLNADADNPTMVLKVEDNLKKSKLPFDSLRVVLKGDTEADKLKHRAILLKRLAVDLPLIVVADKANKEKPEDTQVRAFVYSNGTWFQMSCTDPAKEPWTFLHCEPNLRGTFKGTTAELKQVVVEYVEKKKAPPAFNKKEPGGFGPEVNEEKPKSKEQGRLGISRGPVFGVIPTVAIGGPLAILAMLFPSLFGSPREILQRWAAMLSVTSILSVVYLLHICFADSISEFWWGKPSTMWLALTVVAAVGAIWAYLRYQKQVQKGMGDFLLPRRGEEVIFRLLSLSGLLLAPYALGAGELFVPPWKEFLLMWAMVWAGTLGIMYLRRQAQRAPGTPPRLALEGVMLGALALACLGMVFTVLPRAQAASAKQDEVDTAPRADQPANHADVAFVFKADNLGKMHSTPLVAGERVFAAVNHQSGLFDDYGRLYCIDARTGKKIWTFDNGKKMKQAFCTPTLAEGRIYVGEGYHQHDACNLYCLNAETGEKIWEFPTKSHTESSPCVVDGKVYFGSGEDGVFCVDAKDGKELWHYEGKHVDTIMTVVDGKLYGGSGYGKSNFMFCLDAKNGNRLWETESKLPVFGSPTVLGKQVFFGTGTGDLVNSDDDPKVRAGAVFCLNADNGKIVWKFDKVGDAVHTKPAVDRRNVYFGSRDGNLYCVDRREGKERWKQPLGGPVVTAPALVTCPTCGDSNSVYAIGSQGVVYCLDPDSGGFYWKFDVVADVAKRTKNSVKPQLLSSPRVVVSHDGTEEKHRIYFGAALDNLDVWNAELYCLEDSFRWPVASGKWGTDGGK